MKILFCGSDKESHYASGPNAWMQRIIPDLTYNHNLDIVPLIFYYGRQEYCPTIQYLKNKNFPIESFSFDKNPYIEDQIRLLLQTAKKLKISIVVANLLVPAYYAAKYLSKAKVTTIGVLHSNDKFYASVIKKFIEGRRQDSLDAFVAVSEYILNKAQKVNVHNTQLISIPCGTPILNIKAEFPTKKIKVLYAGRLEIKQKQIVKLTQAFIDAAQQNNDLQFIIYGSGKEKENVVNMLARSDFRNKVDFGGEISPDKIITEMSKHHVFTLMSDYEGMPIALMEAMACGLVPVCLEEKSGINEIIQHGKNGFIVKNRGTDYQEKLNMLQQNPDLWKEMSNNAIKTIGENYSNDITHRKWVELLKKHEHNTIKPIKIPTYIKIRGKQLAHGDLRKPSFIKIVLKKTQNKWLSFRLFLRPRTRFRKLFESI